MDKKAYKRLSRGKLNPDGRIDLHGMTLSEAQPALQSFILSEYAAGSRLVLVITGKGRTERDTGSVFSAHRGILRRYVPEWLRMAPLRNVVLEVREAHQRHGGGGAYYVYLKRLR
ncbi:Smr/MutS family protein [Aestuariibius insulae]|uniref:Smr/MutS family protein n=1 Tax=Aestuariibius insulae TaxID=2058287 RepID=UPI00345E499E